MAEELVLNRRDISSVGERGREERVGPQAGRCMAEIRKEVLCDRLHFLCEVGRKAIC